MGYLLIYGVFVNYNQLSSKN